MGTGTHQIRRYRGGFAFWGAVVFVLSILCLTQTISPEKQIDMPAECAKGWYSIKDDQRTEITLPQDIKLDGEDTFIIYNDRIASDYAGTYIFVNNAIYRPEIYLDDTLLYQYTDGGLRRNPPELSYQRCVGKSLRI